MRLIQLLTIVVLISVSWIQRGNATSDTAGDTAMIHNLVKLCDRDYLTATDARKRVEWVERCLGKDGTFNGMDESSVTTALYLPTESGDRIQREAPLYPTFANEAGVAWVAPSYRNASCQSPAGFRVAGFCTAGTTLQMDEVRQDGY